MISPKTCKFVSVSILQGKSKPGGIREKDSGNQDWEGLDGKSAAYEIIRREGQYFIAMELPEGDTLKQCPVPPDSEHGLSKSSSG